jgi:hypothetical protein
MITVNKQLLSGTPDDVRQQVEDLASDQNDHEYLAGTRFRELAVQLATCHGLTVSAVTSDDAAVYELEVTLASAPHHGAIVIDRSQPGDHCQMTLERWLPISDEPAVEDAVTTIYAILAAMLAPAPNRHEPSMRRRHRRPWAIALDSQSLRPDTSRTQTLGVSASLRGSEKPRPA